jgi:hypothetical protein
MGNGMMQGSAETGEQLDRLRNRMLVGFEGAYLQVRRYKPVCLSSRGGL